MSCEARGPGSDSSCPRPCRPGPGGSPSVRVSRLVSWSGAGHRRALRMALICPPQGGQERHLEVCSGLPAVPWVSLPFC